MPVIEDPFLVLLKKAQADVDEVTANPKKSEQTLKEAEKSLKSLQAALDKVEDNRDKFPMISDKEFKSRKKRVKELKKQIKTVKEGTTVAEDALPSKTVRKDDLPKPSAPVKPVKLTKAQEGVKKRVEEDNQQFIGTQKQQTIQMMKQQDDSLEVLGQAVDRLGVMSGEINEEMKEQNKMLDELDKDMDVAEHKLGVVTKSLQSLLKTKDGCQIWTIVILGVILIILVACIIWVP